MVEEPGLMGDGPRGRIALFFLYDTLDMFGFMRDALGMLVERGYSVDVYAAMNTGNRSGQILPGVSMQPAPEAFVVFKDRHPRLIRMLRRGGRQYEWLVMNFYRPLARKLFFNRLMRERHAQQPYTYVIGADPEGLASAAPVARMLGVPLAFWSLELLFADEIRLPGKKRLKEMEKAASREVRFAIIQDRWRGEALSDENGIPDKKLIYVPNAPRGEARRQKSDYLYRRLGIDAGRKIILCAGMLGPWTQSMEIVRAAASWPDEYVLVMQSHSPRERYGIQSYLKELLRELDPRHALISFDPVPALNYRDMMDSADVGLSLYAPVAGRDSTQDRNVKLMGLSSGKFGGYLHSGLPVVVNDAVIGPKEMVEKWDCGISVAKPDEIGAALGAIFQRYELYTANAVRCFNEDLELGTRFEKVIEMIKGFDR